MSDNVHPLRGAQVGDETKQRFLDWMAGAYDQFVTAGGSPNYIAFVVGQLDGGQSAGWTVEGSAQGAADACVSRAIVGLQRKLLNYGDDPNA